MLGCRLGRPETERLKGAAVKIDKTLRSNGMTVLNAHSISGLI